MPEHKRVTALGKFAHIINPEGNKTEFWESKYNLHGKMVGEVVTK